MSKNKYFGAQTIAMGNGHAAAVKTDGTVVTVGENRYGQCDVSEWRDMIAAISGSSFDVIGLKSDGTVVTSDSRPDVSDWRDIRPA